MFSEQLIEIVNSVGSSFLKMWPYLVITIPLAVAVQLSGASRHIGKAFNARPVIAILFAVLVGAFSPFCSCGVIPVIAMLLISGVPLAPVMSFWIASPSMDPEIFFLSVATIGWELAIWRLAVTLSISLAAGFITHYLMKRGLLGTEVLRPVRRGSFQTPWARIKVYLSTSMQTVKQRLSGLPEPVPASAGGTLSARVPATNQSPLKSSAVPDASDSGLDRFGSTGASPIEAPQAPTCGCGPSLFWKRAARESAKATLMVMKFMVLAFFLEALITLYVPSTWIAGILGDQNPWAIVSASLLGVPVYTSNLAALPMVSGLLAQGMSPAAALAFLVAGPTTTLPAMAAVWGLVKTRVFLLYVSFALVGALLAGYLFRVVRLFS